MFSALFSGSLTGRMEDLFWPDMIARNEVISRIELPWIGEGFGQTCLRLSSDVRSDLG
jgi:hypothetical protein